MVNHVHLDFETYSTLDLKEVGVDVYASHESTGVWCMAWALNDEPVKLWKKGDDAPTALFDLIISGYTIIAHNASFELAIWNKTIRCWPELKVEQVECTMAMAYAMALPGSLEKAAAAVGIDKQKDMQGSRIMLQLCQPRRKERDGTVVWWDDAAKFERLYSYCIQDVEVERELYKRLSPLSDKEKKLWILDQKINQRGVMCDVVSAKKAIEIVEYEKQRLDQEMRTVTKNSVATCTASTQLKDWINFRGVPTKGVSKPDILEILARPKVPKDVIKAVNLRQEAAKSSTAKLVSMVNRAGSDDRIRGIFQYHGASTGRWAGRGIQPQNFPRPNLSEDEIEDVFKLIS